MEAKELGSDTLLLRDGVSDPIAVSRLDQKNNLPLRLCGRPYFQPDIQFTSCLTIPIKSVKKALYSSEYNGKQMMRVRCKIWLDHAGKAFGEGPCELLRRVERTDSLHEAAHQMNMSYSKAWKLVQTVEKRLGFAFLDKKIGGLSGGGSRVTPEGKEFLRRYERFESDARKLVENTYQKHFGNRSADKGKR